MLYSNLTILFYIFGYLSRQINNIFLNFTNYKYNNKKLSREILYKNTINKYHSFYRKNLRIFYMINSYTFDYFNIIFSNQVL
jgi:hypothetical protein